MSKHATDETDATGTGNTDRYGELTIGDEEFVVYDRQNHQAWIQSTVAVAADDLR
ncbi:MAG: hypothetical protein V5A55_09560 [Halovenus sp.]